MGIWYVFHVGIYYRADARAYLEALFEGVNRGALEAEKAWLTEQKRAGQLRVL